MNKINIFLILILYSLCVKSQYRECNNDKFLFIENNYLRLGVDLTCGGSIFYIGESLTNRNLINHYDTGRFIQQSYYGKKDDSDWAGQTWCWNPIQGGGYKGEKAKIINLQYDKESLSISSIPKHWATGKDITEMLMHENIELIDSIIHIKFRMEYQGDEVHPESQQEVPAIFVDYQLKNLYFYEGDKAWNLKKCRSLIPGWPNEYHNISENWAAYIDDSGWGIGFYIPIAEEITAYRFDANQENGSASAACSYFAPIKKFSVSKLTNFEYDVYITIGNKEQIRFRFYNIHNKLPK